MKVVVYGVRPWLVRVAEINVRRVHGTLRVAHSAEEALRMIDEEATDVLLLEANHRDTPTLRSRIKADGESRRLLVLPLRAPSGFDPDDLGPPPALPWDLANGSR